MTAYAALLSKNSDLPIAGRLMAREELLEDAAAHPPGTLPLCHPVSSQTHRIASSAAPPFFVFICPFGLVGSRPEIMTADADEHLPS